MLLFQGQKLLGDYIFAWKVFFKALLMGGVEWVGIADPVVEETVLLVCAAQTCVSMCQLFSDAASCFSRTHT